MQEGKAETEEGVLAVALTSDGILALQKLRSLVLLPYSYTTGHSYSAQHVYV